MQPPDAVPSLLSAAAPVERHVRDHYTVKGNAWGGLRVATVMRRSSRNDGVCGFNRRVCRGRAHPKAARYRWRRRHARAFIADIRTRDGSSADIRRLRRTADPRSQNRPVPRPGRHRPLRVVCRTEVPRHPIPEGAIDRRRMPRRRCLGQWATPFAKPLSRQQACRSTLVSTSLTACRSNERNVFAPSQPPSSAITPSAKSPPASNTANPASTAGRFTATFAAFISRLMTCETSGAETR